MKAMILAAGKGTRVRPLTQDIPKPMIPLVRKPVMESIIELLKQHGVQDIVVNTSHLAPAIENYFRDGEQFGVRMAYSFEGRLKDGELHGQALGSAGGMKKIQEFSGFFDETFIVLCGDALIDLDISEALRLHRERKALATIILKDVPREEVYKYGVVKTDETGRILQFQEKPAVEQAVSTTINTGIYIFEPEVLDYVPAGVEYDIGGQLFPALVAAGEPFYGVALPFQWVDIGSIPDFWEANRTVLSGGVNGYRLPGTEVRPGVRVGINVSLDLDQVHIEPPVYIGSGTFVGKGATIQGPSVIGANCVVESGAAVRECLVGDYTRISAVAELERKIVFGGKCIQPDGQFLDIQETDIGWIMDDARKEITLNETQQMLYDLALESNAANRKGTAGQD
jgi:mannose-1-phosphate guanylyltransferase